MGYSLYLRRRETTEALDLAQLEAALAGYGAVRRESSWDLTVEGGHLQARVAGDPGKPEGLDLEIPFGGPEADYRAALLMAASTAGKAQLALIDPQLGIEVGPSNAEDSVARWKDSNRYALDTAGLSEDPRRDLPIEAPPPAFRLWVKVVGVAVCGLVLAVYVLNWVVTAITSAPKPID